MRAQEQQCDRKPTTNELNGRKYILCGVHQYIYTLSPTHIKIVTTATTNHHPTTFSTQQEPSPYLVLSVLQVLESENGSDIKPPREHVGQQSMTLSTTQDAGHEKGTQHTPCGPQNLAGTEDWEKIVGLRLLKSPNNPLAMHLPQLQKDQRLQSRRAWFAPPP
jgi:hypothetical protein